MMKNWGYARCSTNEDKQDINRQIRELKAAGADAVVFEYEHGDAKVKRISICSWMRRLKATRSSLLRSAD